MFGTFPALAIPRAVKVDPKDIPPPTAVILPTDPARLQQSPEPPTDAQRSLSRFLQTIYRPPDVSISAFEALGVRIVPNVSTAELLPDASYLPDFQNWDGLSLDEVRERNEASKSTLNTGVLSPGCQNYRDRKQELSISNDDAFRVVRRLGPPKGRQQARLGNSYEFYRSLESFTAYWDDTSTSPPRLDGNSLDDRGTTAEAEGVEEPVFVRTSAGVSMPPEYRQNLVIALIKLVAYDFGCNASASRTEPRLHVRAPLDTTLEANKRDPADLPSPRASYFASGCTFVYRSPRTRETARQGLVDGPVASVSARATTIFENDTDYAIDFAREIVGALLTAQHRAREGKTEQRPGQGLWWTTKPRWGGAPGGPIGREIDRDGVQGDKDAKPGDGKTVAGAAAPPAQRMGSSGLPASKRPRKQMSIYDNYRMVRPPSASWDSKTRYEAIGKVPGVGYDDIFVISGLFHHVSVLRVRVPDRLLEVLGGANDEGEQRSWGELEVLRTRWFDMFIASERIDAMQAIWAVLAWMMRKSENGETRNEDTNMHGA